MKRLERSRDDRVLGGVCGGLADHWGVDADLVRVAWIATGLLGGIGVIPYIVAVFLIPEGEPSPSAEPRPDRLPRNLGLLLIALAGFWLLALFDLGPFARGLFSFWSWRVLLPLILVAGGIMLVWPKTREAIGFSRDRRVQRSVSDRVLSGVAGGIAEEFDVDANLVRLGIVFFSVITSGLGIVLYLLLTIVLPERDSATGETASAPPAAPPAPAEESSDQDSGASDR